MDHQVYICYAHQNKAIADSVCKRLENDGVRCWYAPRDLNPGADWTDEIKEAIIKAKAVIVIYTDESAESVQVSREISFAVKIQIPIIPFKLTDKQLNGALAFYLSSFHWLDSVNKPLDTGISELSGQVCSMLGTENRAESGPMPQPPSSPPPISTKSGSGSSLLETAGTILGEIILAPAMAVGSIIEKISERKKEQKKEKDTQNISQHEALPVRSNFSVISPKAVKPDSKGIIDLYMYTDAHRDVVDEAIRKAGSIVSETTKTGFNIKLDTVITARLESNDAEIADALETQTWNGEKLHFDFQFYIPEKFSNSQAAFTCYIECNGIPITRLNFIIAVTKIPESGTIPAKITKNDYRKAFISYSRKDEQRMLARVLGIKELAPEMIFWLDKQSMDAGVIWRKEIRKAILISDVLLLFWSIPASQSKEVEKEWSFALKEKGLHFIAPVPLDPPDVCPPPEPLQDLNFSVRAFSHNEITSQLSFYDSNNIELI